MGVGLGDFVQSTETRRRAIIVRADNDYRWANSKVFGVKFAKAFFYLGDFVYLVDWLLGPNFGGRK